MFGSVLPERVHMSLGSVSRSRIKKQGSWKSEHFRTRISYFVRGVNLEKKINNKN